MKGMKISRSMLLWGGIFLAIVMFLGSYSVKEGFAEKAEKAEKANVKPGDACSKSQLNKASGTMKCTYDSKRKKYTWTKQHVLPETRKK